MKLRLFAVFTALFMSCAVAAQTDFRERFQEYKFSTPALGTVEYCTFRSTINTVKPILLFIHGSGNLPTFHYRADTKTWFWSGFSELEKYKDKFHVIFVSKPGIPLFDTVQVKDGQLTYPVNSLYTANYNLNWRAESAAAILDHAVKNLSSDTTQIIVMGHSQGGQVAPKTAVLNKRVTHVVMLCSNSLNHIYDFVMQERLLAYSGEQTHEQAQNNIDSLMRDYQRFFNNPTDTSKYFYDETYLRWASFSSETPLDNMLKLNIPILLIAGGKDIYGSLIMNTDYAQIEFMRKGKNNLTYKVYPNCNHFLQDELIGTNKETLTKDRKPEIFAMMLDWAGTNRSKTTPSPGKK